MANMTIGSVRSQAGANMAVNQSATAKEGTAQMKTTMKDLKDNYQSIETKINAETKKQREHHKERYSKALDRIQTLKKLLKTEVEQRKNAEDHFKDFIKERYDHTLNNFTVTYLNKLQTMRDTVESFESRKQNLEKRRSELRHKIDTQLRSSRESLVREIESQQVSFEQEYQKQVNLDVKELKNIGELEHNFETMT